MNIRIQQINVSSKNVVELFIESFLNLFNQEENLKFLSLTNIPFTRIMVQEWISHAEENGDEYYVAIHNTSDIVGILTVRANPSEKFEIIKLVVDQQYRRLGIGKQFIATAVQKAREKGYRAIDVAVSSDNKNMLSLMIKYDFKPVKIEHHQRFDGEDIVFLKKYLT